MMETYHYTRICPSSRRRAFGITGLVLPALQQRLTCEMERRAKSLHGWAFLADGERGRGKMHASVQRQLALKLARYFALVSATPCMPV